MTKTTKSILEPLWYELWMLNECADLVRELRPTNEDEARKVQSDAREKATFNAAVEAFLTHYRCLLEFVLGTSERGDIRLDDFEEVGAERCERKWIHPESKKAKPLRPLKGVKEEYWADFYTISGRLSHLGRDRQKENLGWETENLRSRMNEILRPFFRALRDDRFCQDHTRDGCNALLDKGQGYSASSVSSATTASESSSTWHLDAWED